MSSKLKRDVPAKRTKLRYQRTSTCKECRQTSTFCKDRKACTPVRRELRRYSGIRLTSDGFDCALPLSIDSHSVCSFGCLYCFADNLIEHREARERSIGQTSLTQVEAIFSGKKSQVADLFRRALKYDAKVNGYPCPVQLGAICDPLDNIERQQGWFLEFVKLCIKYDQPCRISTKGNLFLIDEYLKAVAAKPELFVVMFSIISPDERVLALVDDRAPSCAERIESMRRLNEVGVRSWLRFRPVYPGISDATKDHPQAYKELIQMSADAGAEALSLEVGFVPGRIPKSLRWRWDLLEKVCGVPLRQVYASFGKNQACIRPGYAWTEEIMHAIVAECHRYDMTVGISDPVWKQLGDTGCCCGFSPDDPVFGNWQRASATNQLLEAKETGKLVSAKDVIPPWAYEAKAAFLLAGQAGPLAVWQAKHSRWSDKLWEIWTQLGKERGPLEYFQGAMVPVKRSKDGDIKFRYVGLKPEGRTNTPYWSVVAPGPSKKRSKRKKTAKRKRRPRAPAE